MRVLVACEFSGVVRDAFIERGHDALSCDLIPTEVAGPHYQGDVLGILEDGWDMMIAHPPCTHLAISGARWFKGKEKEQAEALAFVSALLDAPIDRIALENPVSVISTRIRKPSQIIQPWQFGHEAQKRTCLWLKNLPCLEPTDVVGKGEFVITKQGEKMPKWYCLPDSLGRSKRRSRTYEGIARAMAAQWG